MEDTDSKITVSSISDISSFNPERVITIKGAIPDISRAEAEVTGSHHQFLFLLKRFLRVHVDFKVSSKLRAAYETDLQVHKSLNCPEQWLLNASTAGHGAPVCDVPWPPPRRHDGHGRYQ